MYRLPWHKLKNDTQNETVTILKPFWPQYNPGLGFAFQESELLQILLKLTYRSSNTVKVEAFFLTVFHWIQVEQQVEKTTKNKFNKHNNTLLYTNIFHWLKFFSNDWKIENKILSRHRKFPLFCFLFFCKRCFHCLPQKYALRREIHWNSFKGSLPFRCRHHKIFFLL